MRREWLIDYDDNETSICCIYKDLQGRRVQTNSHFNSIPFHSSRAQHLLNHSCIMAERRPYDPLEIPQKFALTANDVRGLHLDSPPPGRNAVGADANAVNHGQPLNGPNHLDNAGNGPHAPAAADGNAGDRSAAAGLAPGGTGSRQDQRGSSSSSAHQSGSGSSARQSRGHN